MEHLEALQAIADANGGNRAAGLPGYAGSVDYVVERLEAAGYDPTCRSSSSTSSTRTPSWSGSRPTRGCSSTGPTSSATPSTRAPRRVRPPVRCSRSAWSSIRPAGQLEHAAAARPPTSPACPPAASRLMQRGTCGFAVKALNAQAAGAAGVVIMNEGQPGRTGLINMIGDATGLTIPAVFATFAAGVDLAPTPGAQVRVKVDFTADTAHRLERARRDGGRATTPTSSWPAPTSTACRTARASTTTAPAAQRCSRSPSRCPRSSRTTRCASPGGAPRSRACSDPSTTSSNSRDDEADDIALYLNFDMIGSPNYMFGVYDGDNSGGTAPPASSRRDRPRSRTSSRASTTSRGLPSQDSEFSGRSDYGPFIAVGIPAGGLFTGAEVPKTAAEAALYGGVAGAAYDPCYHSFCDNLRGDGQTRRALRPAARGLRPRRQRQHLRPRRQRRRRATAVITFAFDTSTVNGVRAPGKSHGAGNSASPTRTTQPPAVRSARARKHVPRSRRRDALCGDHLGAVGTVNVQHRATGTGIRSNPTAARRHRRTRHAARLTELWGHRTMRTHPHGPGLHHGAALKAPRGADWPCR